MWTAVGHVTDAAPVPRVPLAAIVSLVRALVAHALGPAAVMG